MALPTNADVIVVHGYWLDELTGLGVKQDNGRPATIMFDPVPLLGANAAKTPNLRDLTSNAHLKTRTRVATVDPVTGYYAAQLVASNDPDLDAYSGRKVTFLGEDPFTIEVPYNASTVTVSAEMAAKTGLTQGSSVKAIWLPNASVTTIPTPTPAINYLSSAQTLANIAAGIETHDEDPAAHADIRAVLAAIPEQARDAVGAALVAGSGITVTVDDAANTITLTATGGGGSSYTDEQAQDAFAALIAAGTHSGITFAYNDAGNAISATVAAQSWSQITGKPTFAAVATSGSASDITTGTLPDGVIPAGIARDTEVATAVANLVNSAPGTLDTLGEIATALQADESAAAALATAVAAKAPLNRPIRSVTANTTAVAGELLKVDASGAARTVTPPSSPATGVEVIVMKTDASSNAVVWSGTVDGDSQGAQLVAQWAAASYVYDGTQWLVRSTNLGAAAGQLLTAVTATKTASYTAASGELVPVDTTGGAVTVTSPSGGPFAVRWKAGTTGPTVAAANGFTINGAASATLSLPPSTSSGELVVFQCFGADYQQVAGFKPQGALAAPLTGFVSNAGTTPGAVPVIKPSGDTRAGVWEYVHNSTTGYLFHLLQGASAGNPSALIACGNDNSDGMAILIANKANGKGLVIDQQPTVGGSGYGIHGTQRSATAPLLRLEAQATGAADVMQLLSFSSPAPSATQNLLYVGDGSGQAGVIYAANGEMEWRRNVHILDKDGSTTSYLEVTQNSGIAANAKTYYRFKALGNEIYSYSGTAGTWWPMQMTASGSTLSFNFGGTTTTLGTLGTLTSVLAMSNGKIGFFGATKVVQQTGMGAAATDAATTQTLVNNLRTALINLGLVTA